MISTDQAADQLRIAHNTPAGEPSVSVLARGLVDSKGNVIMDAETLAAAGPDVLLGNDLGRFNTVPANRALTVGANSQAIIFGTFTVLGSLTIAGEVRVGAWPF